MVTAVSRAVTLLVTGGAVAVTPVTSVAVNAVAVATVVMVAVVLVWSSQLWSCVVLARGSCRGLCCRRGDLLPPPDVPSVSPGAPGMSAAPAMASDVICWRCNAALGPSSGG